MSTKTQIANMMFIELGEEVVADVDTDGGNPSDVFNAAYDLVIEETLDMGPEDGWLFAKTRTSVDVNSTAITAFALATATTVTVTSTAHGLITGEMVNISDTTSYNDNFVVTRVDANSYTIIATFVADDATGTSRWISQQFAFRYPIPTSQPIESVQVGGIEIPDWVQENQYILTNMEDEAVDMGYVRNRADLTVTDFPQYFAKLLWLNIAAQSAYSLAQSNTVKETITAKLEAYLPRAIAKDQGKQFVQEEDTSWVDVGHTTERIV